MSGRIEGRVAVITGGASGIGRATVLRFLAEGASVVAADMNEANGKALLEQVEAEGNGGRLRFVTADVSVEADVEHAVRTAVDEFGRLDIMFNNAGVGGAIGPVTDLEVDDWDYTFAVMVRGVFLGTKHAARVMVEQGSGAIVNTASVAGLAGGSAPFTYSACKAAVINFTKAVSMELAAKRVRINAICPGGIATPLVAFGGDVNTAAERLDSAQPWPDHGDPSDIAAAALFLASDDARFVTGEALIVDGGLMAAGPNLIGKMTGGVDLGALPVTGVSRGSTGLPGEMRPITRNQ